MKSRLTLGVALATAVLGFLPLHAGGQGVDGPDQAHRRGVLDQCELLAQVRGWTSFDVVAGFPTVLMDGIAGALRPNTSRDELISMHSSEGGSLLPLLISCPLGAASAHPFDDLILHVLSREQKYFGRFQDSGIAFDQDLEDIDTGELMQDQGRVLFDAGRKFYLGSYGARLPRGFGRDSVGVTGWTPADFVIAPALVSGGLFLFGWEKDFNLLGLNGRFELEPIRRLQERLDGHPDDQQSAAGVDIGVGSFPLKAIVSVGMVDGDPLIDFIGIGTSLGQARQVVRHAQSSRRETE